jgi:hypothetical protein
VCSSDLANAQHREDDQRRGGDLARVVGILGAKKVEAD